MSLKHHQHIAKTFLKHNLKTLLNKTLKPCQHITKTNKKFIYILPLAISFPEDVQKQDANSQSSKTKCEKSYVKAHRCSAAGLSFLSKIV